MKTIAIAVFTAIISICVFFSATQSMQKNQRNDVAVFGRTLKPKPCPPCADRLGVTDWRGVHRRVTL